MAAVQHNRTTAALILQIGFSHNTKCAIITDSHNFMQNQGAFRGREGAFAPLKTGWPPWAMLCVLLLIFFLKDSWTTWWVIIAIVFTLNNLSTISHKSCSRCNLTVPIFKNFPGGHAPDPLDLACYTCWLLAPPEILILWFSPSSTYFLNVSLKTIILLMNYCIASG